MREEYERNKVSCKRSLNGSNTACSTNAFLSCSRLCSCLIHLGLTSGLVKRVHNRVQAYDGIQEAGEGNGAVAEGEGCVNEVLLPRMASERVGRKVDATGTSYSAFRGWLSAADQSALLLAAGSQRPLSPSCSTPISNVSHSLRQLI